MFVSLHQQNPPRFPMNSEPGRNFYFILIPIMPKNYTKPPISISEQILTLKKRGLIIDDISFAEKILSEISYFRFAAYLRPMENDKITHQFKDNSLFENAVRLYEFDAELRKIIFNAIQHIEVSVRAKVIHNFSMKYGPFWFMNEVLFREKSKYIDNFKCVIREVERSKEDYILEHYRKYDNPPYPPAWKTLELCSFGTLSKLYCNFSDNKIKKEIAHQFNVPNHIVLESWLRSLALLRNYCAHHARLWNRLFNAGPQMNVKLRGSWILYQNVNPNKLYALLCCMAYCLDNLSLGKGKDFKCQLKKELSSHPSIDINAMGFTKNWEQEPLWDTSL